jgi:hypothetical protein
MTEHSSLPIGWFDLVHDLRLALHRELPAVAITDMTSDRGRLHVRYSGVDLNAAARVRLDRLVQRYVTQSLSTCMCCGSGYGRDRSARNIVTEALPHDPSLTVHELKEKFGCMRIWCDTDVTATRLAKAKAEIKSGYVCEVCGANGYVRRPPPDGGYARWRCLCDEHARDDQRSWGTRHRPSDGMMQCDGQWYRYDRETDSMLPSEPPEGFRCR